MTLSVRSLLSRKTASFVAAGLLSLTISANASTLTGNSMTLEIVGGGGMATITDPSVIPLYFGSDVVDVTFNASDIVLTFNFSGTFGQGGIPGLEFTVVDNTDPFASYTLTSTITGDGPKDAVSLSGDVLTIDLDNLHIYSSDSITIDPTTASPVPEPGSLALLGTGLCAGAGMIRRRLAKRAA